MRKTLFRIDSVRFPNCSLNISKSFHHLSFSLLVTSKADAQVFLPNNLAPGNYLARNEITALHNTTPGGAEFYPGCAQLRVGGSQTGTPNEDELASFPGAYSDNNPGINDPEVFDVPKSSYVFPGPKVASFVGPESGTPPSNTPPTARFPTDSDTSPNDPSQTDPSQTDPSTDPSQTDPSTDPYPTDPSTDPNPTSPSPNHTPPKHTSPPPFSPTDASTDPYPTDDASPTDASTDANPTDDASPTDASNDPNPTSPSPNHTPPKHTSPPPFSSTTAGKPCNTANTKRASRKRDISRVMKQLSRHPSNSTLENDSSRK
jgi:Auxiliary Activity family 9 (formerly GH61)